MIPIPYLPPSSANGAVDFARRSRYDILHGIAPDSNLPLPRRARNNQLIVFGGMSNEADSPNPDELCVLNDVRFFDIASRHWLPPSRLSRLSIPTPFSHVRATPRSPPSPATASSSSAGRTFTKLCLTSVCAAYPLHPLYNLATSRTPSEADLAMLRELHASLGAICTGPAASASSTPGTRGTSLPSTRLRSCGASPSSPARERDAAAHLRDLPGVPAPHAHTSCTRCATRSSRRYVLGVKLVWRAVTHTKPPRTPQGKTLSITTHPLI
ncbi:hypothetical protein DFH07DRAFT_953460 [Mycena maculata]|uniref:Uncharacterized protein n=1 Tax=Mycena maculata TaxID=230809 RepID=A0AAD7JVK4_9AGAR|nr:hypothetical protein DFH07DRAFT_953460 [Mycena maculata]